MAADRQVVLEEIGFEWEEPERGTAEEAEDDGSSSEDEESSAEAMETDAPIAPRRQKDHEKWMYSYNSLRSYYKKHKTFNISYNDQDMRFLYYWTWRQRKLHKENGLPPERLELLAKIGFFGSEAKQAATAKPAAAKATARNKRKRARISGVAIPAAKSDSPSTASQSTDGSSEYEFAAGTENGQTPMSLGKVEGKLACASTQRRF